MSLLGGCESGTFGKHSNVIVNKVVGIINGSIDFMVVALHAYVATRI